MSFALRLWATVGLVLAIGLIATFQRPPVTTIQRGYRGVGEVQNYDPRQVAAQADINVIPASLPEASASGPKAGAVYKNVKVLGALSVGQFTRLMATMTTWVAPKQGCSYCHEGANFASDAVYTKIVARRMLQMTHHLNAEWQAHVAPAGVTCWTCHRGNPVPLNIWFEAPKPAQAGGFADVDTGKNRASVAAGYASLPYDPFTPFLEQDNNIRVQAAQALPGTDNQSIKQTDWTYALMIHMANALGVNCTYCHNSRAWSDWSQSAPQRAVAWYGIRMVRDLNKAYLASLHGVFPPARLGPLGDVAKVNCTTCHQGAFKPLYGANMIANFPELAAVDEGADIGTVAAPTPAAATAPAPAAAPAPDAPKP